MTGTLPLAGCRVIDLSHVMAGPVCTLLLADLGAEVIKVERPPGGDDSRRMGPPFLDGESAAFLMMNRNKRGIALDLKTEAGRAALGRLIAGADVLVENYRRGTMEKLGLGWETLRRRHPGLIYCAISGFGRSGPLADHGGFDLMAQALSGIMSVTGEGPGRPPVKCGPPVTDITAGLLAALGIAAAYARRQRSGEGGLVDTSLYEAGIMHSFWQSAICLATGRSPQPMGSAHPLNAPYQAFATADGWLAVGAANQRNWLRLTEALERPDLAADPRFADNLARMTHLAALEEALTPLFAARSTADWLARLEAAGVPAAPVRSIGEMLEAPQTLARDMVIEVDHAALGPVKSLGTPVKIDGRTRPGRRGAPRLGADTAAVLAEAGFTAAEIATLLAEGAALQAAPPGKP
ncbi:MAG: CoA transferase [Thalassobaculales bacterium]